MEGISYLNILTKYENALVMIKYIITVITYLILLTLNLKLTPSRHMHIIIKLFKIFEQIVNTLSLIKYPKNALNIM